ncbi:MAG: hypothetical protein KDB80_09825 [Planctomycetes bacterium]|nr:hypothetical protein [Planctomycetota bacterium]
MLLHSPLVIVTALVTNAVLSAQLDVTATANEFRATGVFVDELAAGTVLIPGTVVSGTGASAGLTNRTAWGTSDPTSPTFFQMNLGVTSLDPLNSWSGPFGHDADVDIALSAATPTPIHVSIDFFGSARNGTFTGSLTIPGVGTVMPGDPTFAFDAILDSTPWILNATIHATSIGSTTTIPPTSLQILGACSITIVPRVHATTFGSACNGATMTYESTLNTPPTVTIADPAATFGILYIATQQLTPPLPLNAILPFPTWTCPLRVDNVLVAIPIAVGPPSQQFSFGFLTPPGTFTMQALTAAGTVVNSTNGLEFVR